MSVVREGPCTSWVTPVLSRLSVCPSFPTAAAPSSPAVAAPGPGTAPDSAARGAAAPVPASRQRWHRAPLTLGPGLSGSPLQGGQEWPRWGRPPGRRRGQVGLEGGGRGQAGAFSQRCSIPLGSGQQNCHSLAGWQLPGHHAPPLPLPPHAHGLRGTASEGLSRPQLGNSAAIRAPELRARGLLNPSSLPLAPLSPCSSAGAGAAIPPLPPLPTRPRVLAAPQPRHTPSGTACDRGGTTAPLGRAETACSGLGPACLSSSPLCAPPPRLHPASPRLPPAHAPCPTCTTASSAPCCPACIFVSTGPGSVVSSPAPSVPGAPMLCAAQHRAGDGGPCRLGPV